VSLAGSSTRVTYPAVGPDHEGRPHNARGEGRQPAAASTFVVVLATVQGAWVMLHVRTVRADDDATCG
jgi:hypothetical protein